MTLSDGSELSPVGLKAEFVDFVTLEMARMEAICRDTSSHDRSRAHVITIKYFTICYHELKLIPQKPRHFVLKSSRVSVLNTRVKLVDAYGGSTFRGRPELIKLPPQIRYRELDKGG